MSRRIPALAAFAALSLLSVQPGWAGAGGGYFVQASVGAGEETFAPHYTFVDGSPSRQFRDQKQGGVRSIGFGYEKPFGDRLSLALSAELIHQTAEWTLSLPWEPATFHYEIPYTIGALLTPAWRPNDNWRLFAELGALSGRAKERKSSPATSRYDADEWVGSLLLGVGVGYRVTDRLEITLSHREMRYDDLDYRSYWATTGAQRADISDSPSSNSTAVGVRYRF